jgi:hypothetical protein
MTENRIKAAMKRHEPKPGTVPVGSGKVNVYPHPEPEVEPLHAEEPVPPIWDRSPEPETNGKPHAGGDPGPGRRGPSSSQSWNREYTTETPPRERIPLKIVSATECAETEPPATATVLGDHWLFRGGWNALIGPTGQGKTSISAQMGALWCL